MDWLFQMVSVPLVLPLGENHGWAVWAVDVALFVIAAEIVFLVWIGQRYPRAYGFLVTSLAGGFLLIGLHLLLTGWGLGPLLLALLASGVMHVLDVRRQLRGQQNEGFAPAALHPTSSRHMPTGQKN